MAPRTTTLGKRRRRFIVRDSDDDDSDAAQPRKKRLLVRLKVPRERLLITIRFDTGMESVVCEENHLRPSPLLSALLDAAPKRNRTTITVSNEPYATMQRLVDFLRTGRLPAPPSDDHASAILSLALTIRLAQRLQLRAAASTMIAHIQRQGIVPDVAAFGRVRRQRLGPNEDRLMSVWARHYIAANCQWLMADPARLCAAVDEATADQVWAAWKSQGGFY